MCMRGFRSLAFATALARLGMWLRQRVERMSRALSRKLRSYIAWRAGCRAVVKPTMPCPKGGPSGGMTVYHTRAVMWKAGCLMWNAGCHGLHTQRRRESGQPSPPQDHLLLLRAHIDLSGHARTASSSGAPSRLANRPRLGRALGFGGGVRRRSALRRRIERPEDGRPLLLL